LNEYFDAKPAAENKQAAGPAGHQADDCLKKAPYFSRMGNKSNGTTVYPEIGASMPDVFYLY
jgi:hypothetical protein